MVSICRYSLRRRTPLSVQQPTVRASNHDELTQREQPLSPSEIVEAFLRQLCGEDWPVAEFNQQAEEKAARQCA